MKDTQDKIGYCQLSLGLLYEDSTEYDNSGEVYPTSKQEISHTKNTNRFVVHEKLLETIMEDACYYVKISDYINMRNLINCY